MLDNSYLEHIRFWDVLDVLIVVYLMYRIYKLLRGTIAIKIFVGVLILYLAWWLVGVFEMQLLSIMLDKFVAFGVIILVIIFQQEVRQFLLLLGNTTTRGRFPFISRLFGDHVGQESTDKNRKELTKAVQWMSEHRIGAILVVSDSMFWQNIASSGIAINGDLSASLLENIFYTNSPLHDGAVIISRRKILAASCVLPVSQSQNFSNDLGLRHRAAVGVTESHAVLAIVVSEETGEISYAKEGTLVRDVSVEHLSQIIFNRLSN